MTHNPPQTAPHTPEVTRAPHEPVQTLLAQSLEAGNGIPAERPAWAVSHGACGKWWTGNDRSHCGACHLLFSSLSAFDRHRRAGQCLPPAEVGLVARQQSYGLLWGWPGPDGGMGAARGKQPAE